VCWSAEERGATDGPVVNTSGLAAPKSPPIENRQPHSSITAQQKLREITSYEWTALHLFLFFEQSQIIYCSRPLRSLLALDLGSKHESQVRPPLANGILERFNGER
jgi:hypothetical protein